VRELKSAVEQALLLAAGAEITPADLFGGAAEVLDAADRDAGGRAPMAEAGTSEADAGVGSFRTAKERVVATFERDFLCRRCVATVATSPKPPRRSHVRQNFQQKMRELGITADDADPDRDPSRL